MSPDAVDRLIGRTCLVLVLAFVSLLILERIFS